VLETTDAGQKQAMQAKRSGNADSFSKPAEHGILYD
jgi:hypothetical protein